MSLQEEEFWSNVRARRERRESEGDKDVFRDFVVSELNLNLMMCVGFHWLSWVFSGFPMGFTLGFHQFPSILQFL